MKHLTRAMACALALMPATTAFAETTVRMLKTWDSRYPGSIVICDRFAELLTEASGGEIKVQTSGPETIPPLQQLEPTQNGLFQVLCTYPGFHTGSATILTGLESIRPDAQAFRDSGAIEVVRETYDALGLHTVSVPLAHGYAIYLNRDLSDAGDLSGMQIRALPPQHPYITAIGGTPVVLPPPEMFSALERGVVDGAAFPLAGATGYGFTEVTSHYFGTNITSPHVILANKAFWDGLPQEVRDVFETQASILEDETPDTYRTLNDQEHARMAEAGMTRLTLSDSVAAKLDDAVVEGAWAFAETRDGETAGRLRAAVEAAGLLE